MPLTVYLFTSLLMMWFVFAPWGLGLWGHFSQAQMLGWLKRPETRWTPV